MISIHQLMNIVHLIQEKWSLIGTRLNLSSNELDEICHAANKQQIPMESKNTFCCVQMLTRWYKTSDNVSFDAIMMVIDAPHVGLKTKIFGIETALTSEYVNTDSSEENPAANPPMKLDKSYYDMVTDFCSELSKSQHSISNILTYLKVCYFNSEVFNEASDFPELVKLFEGQKLLSKTDLSWLKNIADHVKCTKATEVVEKYENSLIADKILWYSSHQKGTYLVGRTGNKPENVTIKDSNIAKSAACGIVGKEEIDFILDSSEIVLDSSEVGSVTFYWKLINEDATIQLSKVFNTSLIEKCQNADLTHIGIMIDGKLNWAAVDEMGMYTVRRYSDCIDL